MYLYRSKEDERVSYLWIVVIKEPLISLKLFRHLSPGDKRANPFVSSFDVVGIRSSGKEKRKREGNRERERESNIIDVFTRCPLRPAIFQRTEKRFSDKRPGAMPRGSQNLAFLRRRQPRSGSVTRLDVA